MHLNPSVANGFSKGDTTLSYTDQKRLDTHIIGTAHCAYSLAIKNALFIHHTAYLNVMHAD